MAKQIVNRWPGYTVADCDCKYCLYYGGRSKGEVHCLVDECVCKAELREAARREKTTTTTIEGEKNMSIQLYNIHLTNGEVLQVGEDYHLKGPKTIVNRFTKATDDEILDFESAFTSMYVPRKSILFIATGDVIA